MALQRFNPITEAWGAQSPRPGAAVNPRRGPSAPTPKMGVAGAGTATANYGASSTVTRPPMPGAPAPAKVVRTAVKRWDGVSRRPQMGGALSKQGRQKIREALERLREYNPYHDASGRFTGSGGAKTTVAYAGKRPAGMGKGKAAIRREMGADAEMKRLFPNGPTSRSFQKDSGGKNRQHAAASALYGEARRQRMAGDIAGSKVTARAAARDRYAASGNERVRVPARGGDREQVPQNPKKYTQGQTDGNAPRPGAAERRNQSTDGGRVSPAVLQGYSAMGRRPGGAQHDMASKMYRHARGQKSEGHRDWVQSKRDAGVYAAEAGSLDGRGGKRQRVPQNPKKYTRSQSDGQAPEGRPARQNRAGLGGVDPSGRFVDRGSSALLGQDEATPRGRRVGDMMHRANTDRMHVTSANREIRQGKQHGDKATVKSGKQTRLNALTSMADAIGATRSARVVGGRNRALERARRLARQRP